MLVWVLKMKSKQLIKLAAVAALAFVATWPVSGHAEEPQSVRLPVVMYHSLLKDSGRSGAYTITPAQFENDLRWLADHGYETVVVADLLAFVNDGAPLPDKPVMLTFDDGHCNNDVYGGPLLRKYGMRAVLSVVGEYADKADPGCADPNFSYLSWERLAALTAEGTFEIQSHSWGMHRSGKRNGCARMRGETDEDYAGALSEDLNRLQDKLYEVTGKRPTAFAYPFGAISEGSTAIVKDLGFQASFSCRYGVNEITHGRPDCLFRLRRNLRPAGVPSWDFFRKLDERTFVRRAEATDRTGRECPS